MRKGSAVGLGLLIAGWVTALVAVVGLPREITETASSTWYVVLLMAIAVVLLGNAVARRFGEALGTGFVAIVAASLFAIITVIAARRWHHQWAEGFVGARTTVLIVGAVAGLIGALVLAVATRFGTPDSTRRRRWLPAAVAAAVVAALAAAGALSSPHLRLDATTTSATTPTARPESMSAVAWRHAVSGQVQDVVAAGPGVIAMVDDGLVALDGTTGKERWHYRRDGAQARHVAVSPDGRTVFVELSAGDWGGHRVVFLDVATGKYLHAFDPAGVGIFGSGDSPMSRDAYVVESDNHRTVTGYALRTGKQLWTYTAAKGCRPATGYYKTRTAGNAVVAFKCVKADGVLDKTLLLGFGTAARPLWTRSVPAPAAVSSDRTGVVVDSTDDGTIFTVSPIGGAAFRVDPATGAQSPATDRGYQRLFPWYPQFSTDERPNGGPLTVRDRNGRVVGVEPNPRCADLSSLRVTTEVTACAVILVDSPTVYVEPYGQAVRTIPVDVGGPFATQRYGNAAESLVHAPGAWVAWTGERPEKGAESVIVGLR